MEAVMMKTPLMKAGECSQNLKYEYLRLSPNI